MIQHQVVEYLLLPDEREPLEKELKRLADQQQVHVIFTTGGTGFSVRDITPEDVYKRQDQHLSLP